ncbi:hypothetical protein [Streptomyces morookaense]|uniref:Lipoprotein n=1 Tax=Streptomyces morookaense TaxID=1970 RepID=A0A7Y7E8P3_STRMO|nr:hypothetical protein [Streptomyces morookaense]NVK79502.1 hypothetical protein [Streptomyces morookaense]GHF04504.1 hypothetical protein GCM10010359_01760 [Streptomyces morookaense]
MRNRAVAAAAAVAVITLAGCSGSSEKHAAFGEAVTVDSYDKGPLSVAVERIDRGSSSDLNVLKDSAKYAGKTPYYLYYKLTRTESGKGSSGTNFVVSDGDKELTHLTIMGSFDPTGDWRDPLRYRGFDKCEGADGFEKTGPGQSVEGCAVYVADAGTGAPKTVKWVTRRDAQATWEQ